jgi:hypothetical protein
MATRRNEADTPKNRDTQLERARTMIAGLLAAAYRRFAAAQRAQAEQAAQNNREVANQGLANCQRSSVHEVVL